MSLSETPSFVDEFKKAPFPRYKPTDVIILSTSYVSKKKTNKDQQIKDKKEEK